MNEKIKEKWCAALDSGKYKQCTLALHDTNGHFCCLGVLTDLYIQEYPEAYWQDNEGNKFSNDRGYCTYNPEPLKFSSPQSSGQFFEFLPPEVVEWAELHGDNPIVYDNQTLSLLNDNDTSFDEISKIIKKQL